MQKLKPPKHLSKESQALWRSIVDEYSIDQAAGMILTATLGARDRREQAREALQREGSVFKDRWGQWKPSPWLAVERDSALMLLRGFRVLGLDLTRVDAMGSYSRGQEQ
jgi:phage terminase small subunit